MENRITLRHLEAFRAIMVRKSVTGAAEMLEVTQPVVTRLIADLEERIALTLFTRTKGRLVPTPEAALLVKDVEQSLLSIERIANAATNIKSLKMGRLEIAASPNMALSFLPRAINSFTLAHPKHTSLCVCIAHPPFSIWCSEINVTWALRCFRHAPQNRETARLWYPLKWSR